ncbi:ABC transporter substrate-binding protein [Neobacillus niacini]|uniref:peptide ABC transporter substrate-binding protein n=1 Tax=Neobacillus niacini TaxID=86668 RepID=UPI0021CB2C2F|nr:peptide ABC transporter substrate-binding protein [Neobacillus niacini]MCM3766337.1 peptide ABC transporter substrate-binding protein [Neobacillus niacini]
MKKFSFIIVSMLVLALFFTGCSFSGKTGSTQSGKNEGKKVLKTNNSSEPGTLHPGLAEGTHDSWVINHIFEGLTTRSPEGKTVPGMAESWESKDGITWIFHLKDNVKWSNGEPVTADDFEYAWKYVLNPKSSSYYAFQLYYLKGAKEYNSAKDNLKALEDAVGVKALDDKTLKVELTSPVPYFLELTSFYTYYPVNKKLAESNPDWYKSADHFVSNGPFQLKEWKHKEIIKLAKNNYYYEKENIHLDEVELAIITDSNTAWQMYQSGEFNLLPEKSLPPDIIGKLLTEKNPEFHTGPYLSTYYLDVNTDVKPFNNPKIRQALSMAMDRKAIVTNIAQGGQPPAYSFIPPGIPDVSGDFQGNTGNLIKEDLAEAKRLLKEGLAEEGMSKVPSFNYLYNTDEKHKAIGEALQEMWRKNLGIEMTLENVEQQVKLDRQKTGDYVISRAGWVGDYVDPMTFLDLFITGASYNDPNWSNKEYDTLIQFAQTATDKKERMNALHKAEKILVDEAPIIPIYFYTKPLVYKESITGVFTLINDEPSFKYADIK